MSVFDLDGSLERARRRAVTGRAPRSDRGKSRLPPPVRQALARLLRGQDRPPMRRVMRELAEICEREGRSAPARATVYAFMAKAPTPSFRWSSLPPPVQATLHNLDPESLVPGPQVVHRAFNAGDVAAISFASSLPWLCLYQASEMRGFRPKSLALLRAIMRTRGIR